MSKTGQQSDIFGDGWVRSEERPVLRRLEDLALRALDQHALILTDFLNPRERVLANSVGRHFGLQVGSWGGHSNAERMRCAFAPDYWGFEQEDYDVSILLGKVENSGQLSHGDVMGSLLGTGLKRQKIGDIGFSGGEILTAVCREVADYVMQNWTAVGKARLSLETVMAAEQWPMPEYTVTQGTVPSLRMDAVLAEFCHWSRSRSQEVIRQGKVNLNFSGTFRVDEEIAVGDVLSIRGFGRVYVMELEGETRRGKLRVTVGILKS